ncbi:MAG: multiheme c-type cytochrome, partial [Bythopirellula sp.]
PKPTPPAPQPKADLPVPKPALPAEAVQAPPEPIAPAPAAETPFAPPAPPQVVPSTPVPSPFLPPPAHSQPTPHSTGADSADSRESADKKTTGKTRCEFIAESQYPSAQACAKCHEKIYDEWSISSHAYAAVSPMFHKFEQTINNLSQGTIGYFCYRCHAPVGTTLGISRDTPLWDLPLVAREGVTCVACHRVNQRYGKVNGERRIEPGDIHAPVYGSIGGGGIAEVIAKKSKYKVKTSPQEKGPGQDIHVAGFQFDQLGKSEFCVSCHQVAVHPGIKLEVVWEQYRASPACKKGISCQDCHMGRIPGVPSGYEYGAAAKVGDKVVNSQRKHANHVFYGPGYSIAHPGVFPHNIDANRWSMKDWLKFDWRAGWGTEQFEELLDNGRIQANFPPVWAEADDRYDAREVIDDNLKKLAVKKLSRQQIMENGSHVDGPFFDSKMFLGQDLKFHYVMTNTNEGHNLPSGSLGAQPQLWANVVLIGPRGQRVWESGYTDSWGDVADIHSLDVQQKQIPYDWQLFNLQTMFLITGVKGTDREFFLPVNFDVDQLPYLRPGAQPISVINHPPFIRMESRSLAPLGSRKIPYKIPAKLLCEPGHYRLSFRLRSRAEPIYFMRFCGSTQEMNRMMNEWIVDFHESSVEFVIR